MLRSFHSIGQSFGKSKAIFSLAIISLGLFSLSSLGRASKDDEKQISSQIFVELAKTAVPSVVNISTLSTIKSPVGPAPGSPDELFRRFFEDFFGQGGAGGGRSGESEEDQPPRPRRKKRRALPKAVALGTGFIIDSSGLILTNNHVVAGADQIKIAFTEDPTETPTDGSVVGRDADLDIALIQVKTKKVLAAIKLGDSDALQVGEYVMAVGNPFAQGHSVTHGIISAKGRFAPDFPLVTYLQTDAPINPGNSGGPLVNLKGEVIGINNAIEARAQGIGFAIPINVVKNILPQLKTKGYVDRGFLGVLVGNLNPEVAEKLNAPKDLKAPYVSDVSPDGPAAKAGIQPYDIVTEFNGKKVHTNGELTAEVTAVPVGKTTKMKILRDGKEKTISLQVGKRPTPEEGKKKEKPKRETGPSHINTGMSLTNLTPGLRQRLELPKNTKGVLVREIDPMGAAAQSGLTAGDVIVEVERKPVESVNGFYAVVKQKKSYLLRVRRMGGDGREGYLVIILDLSKAQPETESDTDNDEGPDEDE